MCKKFRQFGDKISNVKGCDEKCGFFHPNACRNSLNDKTCTYKECRFFHLSGTKTVYKKISFPNKQTQFKKNEIVSTANRFEPLIEVEEDVEEKTNKQVFQEDPNKLGTTLTAIMERLKKMEEKQELQGNQLSIAIQSQQQAQQAQ